MERVMAMKLGQQPRSGSRQRLREGFLVIHPNRNDRFQTDTAPGYERCRHQGLSHRRLLAPQSAAPAELHRLFSEAVESAANGDGNPCHDMATTGDTKFRIRVGRALKAIKDVPDDPPVSNPAHAVEPLRPAALSIAQILTFVAAAAHSTSAFLERYVSAAGAFSLLLPPCRCQNARGAAHSESLDQALIFLPGSALWGGGRDAPHEAWLGE